MSSAVLAGMRLKLLWLWFTSASYAQTFSLFYKHSRVASCVVLKVFASFSVICFPPKQIIYN